jgi:hypothetical protein
MQIAKATPENVDLVQATNQGLALDYLSANKVANLPPTAPYATAPSSISETSLAYAKSVASSKGSSGLANLYGVTNVNGISESVIPSGSVSGALSNLPSMQNNFSLNSAPTYNSVDASVYSDKLATAQTQLSGVTQLTTIKDSGVAGSITSALGSVRASQSPLAKLVNKNPNQGTDLTDFYG